MSMNPEKPEKSLVELGRKTMGDVSRTWQRLFGATRRKITGKLDPDLSATDEEYIKKKIHQCIYSKGGEIASRSRAVGLGEIYLTLSGRGRAKLAAILARDFDVDKDQIEAIRKKFKDVETDEERIKLEMELSRALVPPRVKLLKQFNSLPNGFKFLIDFRAELLPWKKKDPYLKKLDADLKGILSSWFDIGLLDLREITWDSPASLLEKLIEFEAVHEIRSWEDLKNRLVSDRQCFAFFHNRVPDEPLIFVEVALVDNMSDNIQELLDVEASTMEPEEADTAIFYSISSAQKGLSGIHLGNFLIKQVVEELSKRYPNLKHFATLSPLPGFREWLDPVLLEGNESLLKPSEIEILVSESNNSNALRGLLELINTNWIKDNGKSGILKPVLMRLCAHYLLNVKKKGKVVDPVANFHLSNGARIERLNWLADTSEKGLKQSAGIMVNYYYKISDIEKNHELYLSENRINATRDIRKWL